MDTNELKQIVEHVQLTDEVISECREKIASLEAQLSEKTASATVTLDPKKVETTLEKMAEAKFIQRNEREKFQAQIMSNPEQLLSMLDKLAERENATAYVMGKPVAKEASVRTGKIVRDSDAAYDATIQDLARKLN